MTGASQPTAPAAPTAPAGAGSGEWRVLPFEVAGAPTLLAGGWALLDGLAEDPTPTVRWYRAATPALVLGRGQPELAAVAERAGLVAATRFSGGGAVLLDGDLLSCDVALPASHPWLDGGVTDVFLQVGRAWAEALAALGVDAPRVHHGPSPARRRGTPRERLLAAVCYATVGRGEVTVGGRKLVGLAQRRRRPGALVQCGLVRRWRPGRLLAALGADPSDAEVADAAVGLDDLVAPAPTDAAVVAAVTAALSGYSVPGRDTSKGSLEDG